MSREVELTIEVISPPTPCLSFCTCPSCSSSLSYLPRSCSGLLPPPSPSPEVTPLLPFPTRDHKQDRLHRRRRRHRRLHVRRRVRDFFKNQLNDSNILEHLSFCSLKELCSSNQKVYTSKKVLHAKVFHGGMYWSARLPICVPPKIDRRWSIEGEKGKKMKKKKKKKKKRKRRKKKEEEKKK
ncbi:hypothetical protein BHE74_00002648 [Ensete ventricosum]|nr:hypothetical protein BHE74_00002648 [Ensete ventricosum]